MAIILNIDTTTEDTYVCLADNGNILAKLENKIQKKNASFLHLFIDELFKIAGTKLTSIDAVAIVAGPGSYTGLRIGVATAKGLCYALQKPLIMLNSLEIMTYAAIINQAFNDDFEEWLYCPLIVARHNEVFTALYDKQMNEILLPRALILKEIFLQNFRNKRIFYFGNGLTKLHKKWLGNKNICSTSAYNCDHISDLSFKKLKSLSYGSIINDEPYYIKKFFNANL